MSHGTHDRTLSPALQDYVCGECIMGRHSDCLMTDQPHFPCECLVCMRKKLAEARTPRVQPSTVLELARLEDELAEAYSAMDALRSQLAEANATTGAMREALNDVGPIDCDNVNSPMEPPCGDCYLCGARKALSSSAGREWEARVWDEAVEACAREIADYPNAANALRRLKREATP